MGTVVWGSERNGYWAVRPMEALETMVRAIFLSSEKSWQNLGRAIDVSPELGEKRLLFISHPDYGILSCCCCLVTNLCPIVWPHGL